VNTGPVTPEGLMFQNMDTPCRRFAIASSRSRQRQPSQKQGQTLVFMSAALYSILFSPAGPQQGVTTATAYVGEETEPGIFRQGHTNRVPCIYMRALYKEMN
jgi:hypothetical protein